MHGVEEELRRPRGEQENVNGAGIVTPIPSSPAPAPYVGVFAAARRHPFLALVPVVVLVAGAVAVGLHRSPNYSATTHLEVGGVNLNAPGALTGFSTATAALASAYSRAVYANEVITPVARRYHLTAQALRSRISATPIPQSPLFSITAKDTSGQGAIALANAVSSSLLSFIGRASASDPGMTRLYNQYRVISSTYNGAQIRAATAQQKYLHSRTSANFNALRDARTAVQVAQLQASTIQSAYRDAAQGQQNTTTTSLLDSAAGATSDRTTKLELLAFIGLLAGLAIGLALATARANREARRLPAL
jgi:hypothetical protein